MRFQCLPTHIQSVTLWAQISKVRLCFPKPPHQKGSDRRTYPTEACTLQAFPPDTCKLRCLRTSRELSERIWAGWRGEDPAPAPDLLPSFASPGAQRPGIWSSPCCAAFSSFGLEAFCSAACQRVRGCRRGHKGGLGRNLSACRVIHQTLSRLPALAPSHSIPLPAAAAPHPHPLRLLSPVTLGSKENPRPWGGRGGTPQTLGKGQRLPPPTIPQCVKTQQVAVAWRKVAFVALSESRSLLKGNKCGGGWGKGRGEDGRAVPGAHSYLPSPLQSSDRSSGAGLTLTLATQSWPA